jgi:hypothetical protein
MPSINGPLNRVSIVRNFPIYTGDFANSYHAFFVFLADIFIFYGRKKAFLQLWHDSFTVVEKHFHGCRNKFCCWTDDKMYVSSRKIGRLENLLCKPKTGGCC